MPPGFQEWAESVSLWQVIGWSAGIVGLFVFGRLFIKKGWPATKRFATAIINLSRVIDAVQELPSFIERTDATLKQQDVRIEDIHHEVHFNNGTSAKDAIVRVEKKVNEIAVELAEAKADLSASDAKIRLDLEVRRGVEDTRNEEEQHD